MEILTKKTVRLGARAAGKEDAIRQCGELLVRGGYVDRRYVAGMLARERALSTYLGNGVAIPHGQLEDLALVYYTGVSVLQLPEGVEWDPGEKAHLVVGLSVGAEDHTGVLANLTEVVQDPRAVEQLAHTGDAMDIVERLTRGAERWNVERG